MWVDLVDRIAVFVDAGYLFAQGSTALSGSKRPRTELVLDPKVAVERLKAAASDRAPDCKLLRVYWYDGAIGGTRPTGEQALLAHMDDVKLRLGFVNSAGQQKGVDSLIVTDLIELARLGSLSDAILVSGDEDVRVGVQIAQNYGVRVHLLGIAPSRGSQSQQLLQEADTTTEWDGALVGSFLSLRVEEATKPTEQEVSSVVASPSLIQNNPDLEAAVEKFVSELKESDISGIAAYWETERGVPFEHDRLMLPRCREVIGRNLEPNEKRFARGLFQRLVKARLES